MFFLILAAVFGLIACLGEWLLARRAKLALFAGVLAFVLLPAVALAADTAPITVGTLFGDARSVLEPILGVVATGVVSILSYGVWRLTGVKLDESLRASLQSAMEGGIHAGLNVVQGAADRTTIGALDSKVIQVALRYVRSYAPDAVKHFGLDDRALAELLKAQLGRIVPTVPGN